MRVREYLKHHKAARDRVMVELRTNGVGFYGRGLSSEGYAGGYLAALDDVEAMLTHGSPRDDRHYWFEYGSNPR